MKTVSPKRLGRPATGRDPLVAVRLPEDLLAKVTRWANIYGMDRSAALRSLIDLGLQAPAKKRREVVDPKYAGRWQPVGRKQYSPKPTSPTPEPVETTYGPRHKRGIHLSPESVKAAADRASARAREKR
jgi:hypothetical protein